MRKFGKPLLVLIALGLVAAALLAVFREREPSANGHPLSFWVLCFFPEPPLPTNPPPPGIRVIYGNGPSVVGEGGANYVAFPDVSAAAYQAIQQIGTNALPFLKMWSQYQPPAWRFGLARRGDEYPCPWILKWLSRTVGRPVNLAERSRWVLLAMKDPPTVAAFTNSMLSPSSAPGVPWFVLDIKTNAP